MTRVEGMLHTRITELESENKQLKAELQTWKDGCVCTDWTKAENNRIRDESRGLKWQIVRMSVMIRNEMVTPEFLSDWRKKVIPYLGSQIVIHAAEDGNWAKLAELEGEKESLRTRITALEITVKNLLKYAPPPSECDEVKSALVMIGELEP